VPFAIRCCPLHRPRNGHDHRKPQRIHILPSRKRSIIHREYPLARTTPSMRSGRLSRIFAINAVWLELALTGIDLLAWTQALLLDGDLAAAEPKKLR
jgi:hypothetical protein